MTTESISIARFCFGGSRAALWLAAFLLSCAASLAWAQSAARVMAVAGQAKALDPTGSERALQKGSELFAGEKVVTSEESLVQIRLHDGGYLSVRPNTEMVIDRFVHDEQDASKSSFLVSLLKGGFRSITGLIGRNNPNGYQIRSRTATIGIRGTDHEPVVVLDAPDITAPATPGLYDKVNDGETFITKAGVVLPLRRGDVGFAPFASDVPPQVLAKVPDFYKVELKTDARDHKDRGSEDNNTKSDGNKRSANGLLRPSVAARRDAMSVSGTSADGKPAVGAQPNGDGPTMPAPSNGNRTSTTAPPNGTLPSTAKNTIPNTANNRGMTPPLSDTGSAAAPLLTPEQKRTILQNVIAPKLAPNTPNTPAAPTVPITPTR